MRRSNSEFSSAKHGAQTPLAGLEMVKTKRADARDMLIAATMAAHQNYRDTRLGTFGAASPVRRIDPQTGLVIPEPVQSSQIATVEPARRFHRQRRPGYWGKQFAAKMADDKA